MYLLFNVSSLFSKYRFIVEIRSLNTTALEKDYVCDMESTKQMSDKNLSYAGLSRATYVWGKTLVLDK